MDTYRRYLAEQAYWLEIKRKVIDTFISSGYGLNASTYRIYRFSN